MMGKYKGVGCYIVVVILMLTAWCLTLAYASPLEANVNKVDINYLDKRPTVEQIKQMEKHEAIPFVAWQQQKEVSMKVEDFQRQVDVKVLEVYGDLRLLIQENNVVGTYLTPEDTQGILLTSALAHTLWGNTDVVGYEVQLEEEMYSVRGIIEDEGMYSIKTLTDKEIKDRTYTFDALRLDLQQLENVEQTIQTLENKYELPQGIVNNIGLKTRSLIQLMYIPFWLVGGYGLWKLYHFIYKNYRYWVLASLVTLGTLIMTYIMIRLLPFEMQVPTYILPNQWSDFEFWSRLIESFKHNQEQLSQLPTAMPTLWLDQLYEPYKISLMFAIVSTLIFLKQVRVENTKTLFWQSIISSMVTFSVIVALYRYDITTINHPILWLGVPLYLCILMSTTQLKKYIKKWEK